MHGLPITEIHIDSLGIDAESLGYNRNSMAFEMQSALKCLGQVTLNGLVS